MPIQSYRDLEVWQKAMDLVVVAYQLTERLPERERFGLRSQAERSAVSVPSNIAEGFGRGSRVDYARFVSIARSSLMELETQMTLMVRLKLLDREDVLPLWELSQQVGKMLSSLRSSLLKAKAVPRPKA